VVYIGRIGGTSKLRGGGGQGVGGINIFEKYIAFVMAKYILVHALPGLKVRLHYRTKC
jgi:hypothetical protein